MAHRSQLSHIRFQLPLKIETDIAQRGKCTSRMRQAHSWLAIFD